MNKIKRMNKKGDLSSLFILLVVVFALAITAIIFSKVFLMITSELKDNDKFSDNTKATIIKVEDNTIPLLDLLIFMSLIGLMLAIIISCIYLDVPPAITILFIIGLIVAIFLAGMAANVFSEIIAEPELATTAAQFSYTNLILGSHFPVIILVIGTITIIILYGKTKSRSVET